MGLNNVRTGVNSKGQSVSQRFPGFPRVTDFWESFPRILSCKCTEEGCPRRNFQIWGWGRGWGLIRSDGMINVHNKDKRKTDHAIVRVIWNWEFKRVQCIECCNDFCIVE